MPKSKHIRKGKTRKPVYSYNDGQKNQVGTKVGKANRQ